MKMSQLVKEVFGEESPPQKYKMELHSMSGRINNKSYCSKCGLIALNNNFSRWSVDKGCNSELHPSYKSQRKKAGGILG
jgi:hypothetical protein